MILIDLFCGFIICFIVRLFYVDFWAWKNLPFEYVGNFDYYDRELNTDEIPPEINGVAPLNSVIPEYKSLEGFWFYEIRTEEEWNYFCNLIGIENAPQTLDFSNYYVISINRKLTKLQYNNARWDVEKYGSLVRPNFNLDYYEEGKVYLYQLKQKIFFYYNRRDWEIRRYNLDRRRFFFGCING